jgi:hypothetical protein
MAWRRKGNESAAKSDIDAALAGDPRIAEKLALERVR